MHWWLDGTHARKALGDVMLARMMGWPLDGPGTDYGVKLTPENLQQRLDSLKADYVQFQKNHPDQFQWMIDGINSYKSSGRENEKEQEGAQEF